jgi:hypothetical protein
MTRGRGTLLFTFYDTDIFGQGRLFQEKYDNRTSKQHIMVPFRIIVEKRRKPDLTVGFSVNRIKEICCYLLFLKLNETKIYD